MALSEQCLSLANLPDELILRVAGYLDGPTIFRELMLMNRILRYVLKNYENQFGRKFEASSPSVINRLLAMIKSNDYTQVDGMLKHWNVGAAIKHGSSLRSAVCLDDRAAMFRLMLQHEATQEAVMHLGGFQRGYDFKQRSLRLDAKAFTNDKTCLKSQNDLFSLVIHHNRPEIAMLLVKISLTAKSLWINAAVWKCLVNAKDIPRTEIMAILFPSDGTLSEKLSFYRAEYMQVAVKEGSVEDFRMMLDLGFPVNQSLPNGFQSPLLMVAGTAHVHMLDFLLERGVDLAIHQVEDTIVHKAAISGNIAMLRRTLEVFPMGLNAISSLNYTPLALAVLEENSEAISELLARGAVFSRYDNKPGRVFCAALRSGIHKLMEMCLDTYYECILKGSSHGSLLFYEVATNKPGYNFDAAVTWLRALPERHQMVNVVTPFNQSLLHFAALSKNIEGMEIFVDLGTDRTIQDSSGSTFVHSAVKSRETLSAALQLYPEAKYIRDNEGRTPEEIFTLQSGCRNV